MPNFLIAPDFPPQHFSGWHLLNTHLQRHSQTDIHLLTPSSAAEQNQYIDNDQVDIIYANPFDAAKLIREKGFLAVVRPKAKSDETVIACSATSPMKRLPDLQKGMTVALTKNHDIKLIGLRLLEAANLEENDMQWLELPSFQAVANAIIRGKVDAGFFVASAYHSLSRLTLDHLHILIESHLADITHVVLMNPRRADRVPLYQRVLSEMGNNEAGARILKELNMPEGFAVLTQEDVEFMIDLMDTLLD